MPHKFHETWTNETGSNILWLKEKEVYHLWGYMCTHHKQVATYLPFCWQRWVVFSEPMSDASLQWCLCENSVHCPSLTLGQGQSSLHPHCPGCVRKKTDACVETDHHRWNGLQNCGTLQTPFCVEHYVMLMCGVWTPCTF